MTKKLGLYLHSSLIGNHDAHGKNFSITYHEGTLLTGLHRRLAPLYDLLSTIYYPELTPKMAMKIGGEYESHQLLPRHFEKLSDEIGFSKSSVKKHLLELTEKVMHSLNKIPKPTQDAENISSLIRKRCEKWIQFLKQ